MGVPLIWENMVGLWGKPQISVFYFDFLPPHCRKKSNSHMKKNRKIIKGYF